MSNYFHKALALSFQKRATTKRRNDSVYASDASVVLQLPGEAQTHGTCLRKQYYRLSGVSQSDPEDPTEKFVTSVGEAVHEQVAATFAAAEQLVDAEFSIWIDEVRLSGRIDLIIRPDKKRVGVEVKSVGGYHNTVGVIQATRAIPFAPKIAHLAQTIVYAQHMFEQTEGEMDEWILLYIDRESGANAEHNIKYVNRENIWVNGEPSSITPARVYARWNELWQYVSSSTVPPRDYEIQYSKEKLQCLAEAGRLNKKDTQAVLAGKKVDKGDTGCRYCQFRTLCWTV